MQHKKPIVVVTDGSLLEQFLALLGKAGAIIVDDGPVMTDWDISDLMHTGDNEIVHFSWTDGEVEYSEILTEGGIAAGHFDQEGVFHCEDNLGEPTTIRFYRMVPLVPGKRLQAAQHRVIWEIDSEAPTPRAAAEEALRIQRNPQSSAVVFDVRDASGVISTIDLANTGA